MGICTPFSPIGNPSQCPFWKFELLPRVVHSSSSVTMLQAARIFLFDSSMKRINEGMSLSSATIPPSKQFYAVSPSDSNGSASYLCKADGGDSAYYGNGNKYCSPMFIDPSYPYDSSTLKGKNYLLIFNFGSPVSIRYYNFRHANDDASSNERVIHWIKISRSDDGAKWIPVEERTISPAYVNNIMYQTNPYKIRA